ncbi:MAG TPA: glycosyl transferase family 4 [Oleiagrimonas sp.]|nr:glycosyl transferase family 4 [Oleiagrimonas sp.]
MVSVLLAWAAIAYAHRRGMLDQPGFRRSHKVPTPRGGGIGLVAGTLLAVAGGLGAWPGGGSPWVVAAWCVAAAAVAVIGWVDDHRALSVLPRLLTQLLAAALFAGVVIHVWHMAWAWLPLWVLLAAWSINLHNFMDGIDAILALQILFVGVGLGLLAVAVSQPAMAVAAFGFAAATCGFLLFNWPPARIFMGDVGSGFAGFVVCSLILLLCIRVRLALWPALLLCSAFVADAGFTLAWRMVRGRRWYTAHREHLYQWLVRCGWTHAQTGTLYMLWNLLLAAPLALWATYRPEIGPWLVVGLYAVAAMTWWRARDACLAKVRSGRNGHVA